MPLISYLNSGKIFTGKFLPANGKRVSPNKKVYLFQDTPFAERLFPYFSPHLTETINTSGKSPLCIYNDKDDASFILVYFQRQLFIQGWSWVKL
jgi:hypothetical protein